jgi:small subunit ribosomal protein S4
MARYTGADCKRCRREKTKLFLKGAKCESPKCPIEIRPYPPGEHGRARTKESEYLLQMREKQKAARIYGVLGEAVPRLLRRGQPQAGQDRREPAPHPGVAARQRRVPGRLRAVPGHGPPAGPARPLPGQRHKVDIPSFRVSESDIIEVRAGSVELTPFIVARAQAGDRTVPAWLEVMPSKMRILVHALPARQVIDTQVQEQLIVELYSK